MHNVAEVFFCDIIFTFTLTFMQLLEDWGRAARSKTPPGEEPPWSARNFIPYWSQLLSKEAQRGAAIEILNRVDGEAADREAARLRSAGS